VCRSSPKIPGRRGPRTALIKTAGDLSTSRRALSGGPACTCSGPRRRHVHSCEPRLPRPRAVPPQGAVYGATRSTPQLLAARSARPHNFTTTAAHCAGRGTRSSRSDWRGPFGRRRDGPTQAHHFTETSTPTAVPQARPVQSPLLTSAPADPLGNDRAGMDKCTTAHWAALDDLCVRFRSTQPHRGRHGLASAALHGTTVDEASATTNRRSKASLRRSAYNKRPLRPDMGMPLRELLGRQPDHAGAVRALCAKKIPAHCHGARYAPPAPPLAALVEIAPFDECAFQARLAMSCFHEV